ncbi:hypothetical protein AVEN_125683-1 [Araneus ventricosus]|uniref:Uncharacterized protein n=1 Tax=Araneus ventricosus TaxID=182803 RepID=A0A4Y2PRN8_ARAVE|nr:hypothetical protein AVEN_125683-1 [Araneus ventricosus]
MSSICRVIVILQILKRSEYFSLNIFLKNLTGKFNLWPGYSNALESEDLEDSPAVISPPPPSKPEKANKYKNRLGLACDRADQPALSRFVRGHLRSCSFSHGNKVFPVCAKCGVASASPEHILSCLRLSRETFETDPLLALDFLRILSSKTHPSSASFYISIPEDYQSPSQRVPLRLDSETDIDNALADWSPQNHQENDTDKLEILFSKIQKPSGLNLNFSSSTTDIRETSKLQGPPDSVFTGTITPKTT